MLTSKFISLLRTFSKEEVKNFDNYIKSPYFNKSEAPIKLYAVLLPSFPDFDNFKPEKAFKKAFPHKPTYNEAYLRNVLSDLYKLAEDFLGLEATRTSPFFIANLAHRLMEKRQYKMAEANLARMEALLKTNPDIVDVYSMWRYYYKLKMICHSHQDQPLLLSKAHQKYVTAIKNQCLSDVFECYNIMISLQRTYYQYNTTTDFLKRFTGIIQPDDVKNEPQLAILYYTLQLQIQPDWQMWHNLDDCLQQNKSKLEGSIIFNSNAELMNFITNQNKMDNKQPSGILEKHFALLEENIAILEKNKQPYMSSYFERIVTIGMALKGSSWAKQYIYINSPKLPDNLREGLTAYCLAKVYFLEKDYTETIAILNAISPFYHHYYFQVKALLLYAYYEIDNYDAFMNTIDSFKKTLTNHPELAQNSRIVLSNMVAILLKLYHLRLRYKPKNANQLEQMIKNPELSLDSRKWIESKFNDLKPN